MYDHGFMDNTNRQAVKTDLIHRQVMRPLRHGGSHFVNPYYPWNHGRTYDLSLDFYQQL